ncbi:Hypothetical predicted protein [Mytilus galloprovincialis]|uniref:Uncharacterized protein n=1 Tax=Mytilus galloprovincialis TaxID=29158 RepID=A0A8B6C9F1_MYTGA|nr:Hypothetical predicted protein [Mytilus galloprovincialis]
MTIAFLMGQLDIVKWLTEKVDNKLFDMKETMNNACFMGKLDIVKWLTEK